MRILRFGVTCPCFPILLLVFYTFGQVQTTKSNKERPVELQEILSKLTFTSRINHSFEELNKELVSAVQKRGVNFVIMDKDRQAIRKAGGNDELIKTVDAAPKPKIMLATSSLSPGDVRLIDEENRLYNIILMNYKASDRVRLQKAIDAAKEFLRRFGDDPGAKTQVDWIKPKILIWEGRLGPRF